MGKKKIPAKWLTITQEQEQMIVRDFNNGRVRNQILREHKIPEGQFCYIIRKTGMFSKSH